MYRDGEVASGPSEAIMRTYEPRPEIYNIPDQEIRNYLAVINLLNGY